MIASAIGWIIFGLVVGALARLLVPGRDPMGWFATILLGVAGSFFGGFLARVFLASSQADEFVPASFLGSLLGAILLLLIVRKSRS